MILLYSEWRLQQESNLHFSLRRTTLYPFNYGADARNSNRNSVFMSSEKKDSLWNSQPHSAVKTSETLKTFPVPVKSYLSSCSLCSDQS